MPKPKVVITGASGTIAGVLLPALRKRYDLTLLDSRATDKDGKLKSTGVQIVDLLNKDRDSYRHHFQSADAVVHCAYYRVQDQGDDAYFSSELENLQLAYNVYQVAWEERVHRLVAASTNHAADFYEDYALDGTVPMVTPDKNASDNWYGWAKIAFEQIGQVYASGATHGGTTAGKCADSHRRSTRNRYRRCATWRPAPHAPRPRRLHQPARYGSALHKKHRNRGRTRRLGPSLPDLLRHQRQLTRDLEHRQCPPPHRLRATRQLGRTLLRSDPVAYESRRHSRLTHNLDCSLVAMLTEDSELAPGSI